MRAAFACLLLCGCAAAPVAGAEISALALSRPALEGLLGYVGALRAAGLPVRDALTVEGILAQVRPLSRR